MDFTTVMFGVFAGLTWLIIMLGLAQFARFLKKFDESRMEMSGNIAGIAGQLKKLQATMTELLIEQKKVVKLSEEGVALKQAELTGDFEIVEEPIPGAPLSSPEEKVEPESAPPPEKKTDESPSGPNAPGLASIRFNEVIKK